MEAFDRIVEEIERRRPGDVARAKSLLRRSDALSSAIVYVGNDGDLDPEAADEIIEVLEVILEEVDDEFGRAKLEFGIPRPGTA